MLQNLRIHPLSEVLCWYFKESKLLQGLQLLVVILWSYRADRQAVVFWYLILYRAYRQAVVFWYLILYCAYRQAVVWARMDIKCAPICGPAIFFPTAQQDQLTRVEGKFWRNLQILCQGGPSSPALATTGQHERWHDYAHTCKNSDFYYYYCFYYIYYYFWLCANSDDMNVSHFPVFFISSGNFPH